MPNDQSGRAVNVGDVVSLKGTVQTITDDPNYINCTVLVEQLMPPTGIPTTLQLNTTQVALEKPAAVPPPPPGVLAQPGPGGAGVVGVVGGVGVVGVQQQPPYPGYGPYYGTGPTTG